MLLYVLYTFVIGFESELLSFHGRSKVPGPVPKLEGLELHCVQRLCKTDGGTSSCGQTKTDYKCIKVCPWPSEKASTLKL